MNKLTGKYIIVEIIPSHSNCKVGKIVQISALKIDGLKLMDRFDYRLTDDLVENQDLLNMISYDKDSFQYVSSSKELMLKFKDFIQNIKLLIIDNDYTYDYLQDIQNEKESVFKYLNLELADDVFSKIISKYHLEPSNHLVDLLYEALIYESNHK